MIFNFFLPPRPQHRTTAAQQVGKILASMVRAWCNERRLACAVFRQEWAGSGSREDGDNAVRVALNPSATD